MPDRSASEATYLLLLDEYKMLRTNAAEFTKTQATLIGFGVTAVALIASRGGRASWIVAGGVFLLLFAVWLFYLGDLRRMRRHLVVLEGDVNRAAREAYGIDAAARLLTWETTVDTAPTDFLNLTRRSGKTAHP
jgi:hypothetical protein